MAPLHSSLSNIGYLLGVKSVTGCTGSTNMGERDGGCVVGGSKGRGEGGKCGGSEGVGIREVNMR